MADPLQTDSNVTAAGGDQPDELDQRDEARLQGGLKDRNPFKLHPRCGAIGVRAMLFTPSWFSINMGTGITSILLHNLPYQFPGLGIISVVIFVFNLILFLTFLSMSILRYSLYPRIFALMVTHSTQAFFLGTFSMGFSTIVNMIAFVCIPAFGQHFVILAWALWWINAIISLLVGIGVPFAMFNYHNQSLEVLNGTWLLPSVSPIVAAATGGIVADYLPASHARLTLTISYILWGSAFPVSLLIMAVYFHRLAVHHLPPAAAIVSVFLPLGPCGQGAFAILQFSKVIRKLAMETGVGLGAGSTFNPAEQVQMANALYICTIAVALVIWGLGLFWLSIAVLSIIKMASTDGLIFNMGWWGFTFPLGVFTVATTTLGVELQSDALKILGTVFTGCETLLWLLLITRTALRAYDGRMFSSPCLGDIGVNLAAANSCACEKCTRSV
ncbi:uncharacterized protein L969DRAFT_88536 [Mixia osmundae IAM 14324]|uniref:Sulfite efflux pump SSU1 n=1 Tax=Mixia osmundae (strain CBS 9802 / IAM 14324 / JCM 22182 / KY 12970) TaxID=764103 RepID=G7E6R3_MIXOS|nr:uncharacterized protein L969DRAFT_88536 [Mixia osmundae IAM 14324]KEI39095.1 hypothetical protein L969DRAFT_88536 [Mixia osmundae IAM 14324]GAA98523.1 hypothetical protein E5Q_05209 [Mixia osmundae IAM 14324]